MCVFCNQNRISGQQEAATAEKTKIAIEEALEKIPGDYEKTVAFYGGSFTAIPTEEQESLLGAVQPYLKTGDIRGIRLSTRPDCIDSVILSRLKSYNVKTIELGVQSMDEEVLIASNRGHTAEDAVKASELIKNYGFELILQQMTGLPKDTPERSIKTAEQFIAIKPDGVRIYPTVIIKDTELYDLWVAGFYKEHSVEDAVELCSILLPMYRKAGIPVIRLGLNPTDDLSGGDAVGGAYHPALGELVEGRIYLKKELSLLKDDDSGKNIIIGVAKGQVSKAVGQKRCNVKYITEHYKIGNVKVVETEIPVGEVVRIG